MYLLIYYDGYGETSVKEYSSEIEALNYLHRLGDTEEYCLYRIYEEVDIPIALKNFTDYKKQITERIMAKLTHDEKVVLGLTTD